MAAHFVALPFDVTDDASRRSRSPVAFIASAAQHRAVRR
jgi:hypothetical protein